MSQAADKSQQHEGNAGNDILGQAIAQLEMMARECSIAVRKAWDPDRRRRVDTLPVGAEPSQDQADQLPQHPYDVLREVAARNLSKVVRMCLPLNKSQSPAPDDDWVCLAQMYRLLEGKLQNRPEEERQDRRWDYYTGKYGSLAHGGKLIRPVDAQRFMPVAFWSYKIYEMPLLDGRLQMGGFSRWIADKGFLLHDSQPIAGFHFCFGNPSQRKVMGPFAGILDVRFDPQIGLFDLTKHFLGLLEQHGCGLSWNPTSAGRSSIGDFPVLEIKKGQPLTNLQKILAEAVFSTFFYSNFKAVGSKHGNLRESFEQLAKTHNLDPSDELCQAICGRNKESFVSRYDARRAEAPDTTPLCFEHYYAFLLNPTVSFATTPTLSLRTTDADNANLRRSSSALGTINFYTNIELPPILVGAIRQTLQGIYQSLRDLEEWDEGTRVGKQKGIDTVEDRLGHEVSKAYLPALRFLVDDKSFKYSLARSAMRYGVICAPTKMAYHEVGELSLRDLVHDAWKIYLLRDVFGDTFCRSVYDEAKGQIRYLWNNCPPVAWRNLQVQERRIHTLCGDAGLDIGPNLRVVRVAQILFILVTNAFKHHYNSSADRTGRDDSLDRINDLSNELHTPGAPSLRLNVVTAHEPNVIRIYVENHCDQFDEGDWDWQQGTPTALDDACQLFYKHGSGRSDAGPKAPVYVRDKAIKWGHRRRSRFGILVTLRW